MLSVMPVFHGFGLGIGIHTALIGGACCILVPKFNVSTYAELLIKKQPNIIPGVPTLFEALLRADKLGPETYNKYLERGNIEVAPLAYMRGRTLDDSFIILDEAQNTTREQMKMFLTRLGFGSKIVITGDITQIDLPGDKISGLKEAIKILDGVEDIAICRLTASDVVRHALVQRIVAAYDKFEKTRLPDANRTFKAQKTFHQKRDRT